MRTSKLTNDGYKGLNSICQEMIQVFWSAPDYEFEILGRLISKKNNYSPSKSGKGFFKPKKVTNAEDMVALQIPQEMKELQLVHPAIMLEAMMPKKSWGSDRDNGYTFLQDCLVKNGVLKADSIHSFNNMIVLLPVVEYTDYKCKVRMWKNRNA